MRTLYMNNSGHRWVHLPKERVQVVFVDGHEETRTILFYESFGNFVSCFISIKGKRRGYLVQGDGKIHLESSVTYFHTAKQAAA
jgi:hypothetical protein